MYCFWCYYFNYVLENVGINSYRMAVEYLKRREINCKVITSNYTYLYIASENLERVTDGYLA